ncbi:MAG: phosphotransferase [Candidatus Electryonea clarkiae]|nr:phosphotransferase [Candidatus Electryonea clarkiae]MDP8287865.1 phosphotransferase [Candidatus Electryonea clarkiae]
MIDKIVNNRTAQQAVLEELSASSLGIRPTSILKLKGDASLRTIYRISGGDRSIIGVYGPDLSENKAFIKFTRTFLKLDLPVPELFSVHDSGYYYLLEDLGDLTLFDHLLQLRDGTGLQFPRNEIACHYYEAVEQLVRFQVMGANEIDYSYCYQHDAFSEESWIFDHNYFIDCFAKVLLPGYQKWDIVENELAKHRKLLIPYPQKYFLYRDFQSRNIMVAENLKFIDYQSGRRGAVSYDIASLLYDARADLPGDFMHELLELHIEGICDNTEMTADELHSAFAPFALMRVLQALGAYGNLGILKGRSEYLESIPYGLRNCLALLHDDERLRKLESLSDLLYRIQEERAWENIKPDTKG